MLDIGHRHDTMSFLLLTWNILLFDPLKLETKLWNSNYDLPGQPKPVLI